MPSHYFDSIRRRNVTATGRVPSPAPRVRTTTPPVRQSSVGGQFFDARALMARQRGAAQRTAARGLAQRRRRVQGRSFPRR